jgi:S-adenosylmethionine:tRNA ribosyltransferase-isomerase
MSPLSELAAVPSSRIEASEPPEARGVDRAAVAMLVTSVAGELVDARFSELPRFLAAGDLLVVNTSATLPAALDVRLDGRPLELRLSTPVAGPNWVVELRGPDRLAFRRPPAGARLELPDGAHADLLAPYLGSDRLAVARLALGGPLESYLARHGRAIRYRYVPREWPISAYQTIFATEPGSAEMPSAGRPFTHRMVTELITDGIQISPVTLHTGVSPTERGEPPYPERYRVPTATAAQVNAVRCAGGRVIAVGTTVVRALESAAADGSVAPGRGSTSLVVTPDRGLHAVDGLLTGWHEPESSHLGLLEALAGTEMIERSYRHAEAAGYRWHEFGDLHLILPGTKRSEGRPR